MSKVKINDKVNRRTLLIGNFRNLGPFYSGTDETDMARLILNRSLNQDEIGGIVTLIGANNCGKSNVLSALEKYASGSIETKDYTDFTYAERIQPTLSMEVPFEIRVSRSKVGVGQTVYEGSLGAVFFAFLMEEENYRLYVKHRSEQSPIPYLCFDDTSGKSEDYLAISPLDYIYKMADYYSILFKGGYNLDRMRDHFALSLFKREDVDLSESGLLSDIISGKPIHTNDINQQIRITTHGKQIEDDLFTLIENPPRMPLWTFDKDDARVKGIRELISSVKVTYSDLYDGSIKESEDAYGNILSNAVSRYNRRRISQADLSCKPSDINFLIGGLTRHLGYTTDAIKKSYSDNGMLRHKIEKDLNRELSQVADDFNDLLCINGRRYGFELEFEKENIDLVLTYGDGIPLDLDKQSEGFRWVFDFYFGYLIQQDFNIGDIILMDEFGNSLSFSTIGELIKKIRSYCRKKGLTIVMATQNPMAIDIHHLDEVRIMAPEDNGATRIINNFDEFGAEGDHDVMLPILNSLTVSRNYLRSENRRTVFVEGATDYFYLNGFSEKLRLEGKQVDVDFIPINGLGKFKADSNEILDMIRSIGPDSLMLVDGDRRGEKFTADAKKRGIHPVTLSEIFDGQKREIEDLFSAADAEKYSVAEKSFDRAACLSHRIPEHPDDFDDETVSNFEKVIDYIMMS